MEQSKPLESWRLHDGHIPTVGPTLGTSASPYDNVFLNASGTTYLGGITASSGTFQRINNLTVDGGSNSIGGRYTNATTTTNLWIDGDFTVAADAQFFTGPHSPNRVDFHGAFSVGNGSVIGVNNSTSDSGYWNLTNATSISLQGTTIRYMTNNWQWNAPRWDFGTATITLTNTNTFNLHQDVVTEARNGVGSRGSLQQIISNVIAGTGGITKTGAGTLILNNAGNTYAGATIINAGILQTNGGGAIGNLSAVTLANAQSSVNEGSVRATLWLNGSETVGSLAGGGATGGNVILNTNTLTVGGNNSSTTFSGAIAGSATGSTQGDRVNQQGSWSPSPYTPVGYLYAPEPALGSGSLVKTGSGTTTLTNTNLYEGTTTISQGYLAINSGIENGVAGALGQSTSAVILGDANTLAAASSDSANLGLFFNADAGNQTFLVSRGLDMSGSNVAGRTRIRLQGGTAADASQVQISGPISFGGRRYDIVAQHQQQLINITGKITGTATSVHWNGSNQGLGVVRLADETNDYTGDNTLTNGTLILAGNVAASGPSLIGSGSGELRMGDGAPPSLPMANAASTNIALFMETAGTSFARPVTLNNVASYAGSGGNGVA
ncbi:MAG: autotransporter-associated beta strand repeat-containing protein, partial [Patescibacteria group bacterium]|nr:autotransporter-associated beta strand repeat-containing protein [Patescibacteria group bacterium]